MTEETSGDPWEVSWNKEQIYTVAINIAVGSAQEISVNDVVRSLMDQQQLLGFGDLPSTIDNSNASNTDIPKHFGIRFLAAAAWGGAGAALTITQYALNRAATNLTRMQHVDTGNGVTRPHIAFEWVKEDQATYLDGNVIVRIAPGSTPGNVSILGNGADTARPIVSVQVTNAVTGPIVGLLYLKVAVRSMSIVSLATPTVAGDRKRRVCDIEQEYETMYKIAKVRALTLPPLNE